MCSQPVIEIHRMDSLGKILKSKRLKTQNIQKFLDSMSVIWKPKTLKEANTTYSKFNLGYNEYGVRKRCHSNLSKVRLGAIETDPLVGLRRVS